MSIVSIAWISFLLSAGVALLATPAVIRWASRHDICDRPSARRVNRQCTPRAGGISLFAAYISTYLAVFLLLPGERWECFSTVQFVVMAGAGAVFILGLWDDVRHLSPFFKFTVQVLIAGCVWWGGVRVELLSLGLHDGVNLSTTFSFLVTSGWIILLINAINLIDGLDGLAAGICLFVSLTLLYLSLSGRDLSLVIGFSVLAGICLGFLRYNFNPATIFMGDSGSYLLGYLLAVLTIQGSMKSQATVALLIPVVALGVPLLDTLIAPIRRFLLGKKIFDPDQGHIHHVLLKMGYSHRRVVLMIYGATIFLGAIALLLVFVKDQHAAFVLVLPGALVFLAVKKLGYLEYLAADKVWGWLKDLTDEAGLSNERRSFLNIQMQIMRSESPEELWENICIAVDRLDFDFTELHLAENPSCGREPRMVWGRQDGGLPEHPEQECQFKLEMPLMKDDRSCYGMMWLVKDLRRGNISHYTLRRVEHLRRTVIGVLKKLEEKEKGAAG